MFSMCSELTPHARIPDTRIPQLMQPCIQQCREITTLNERTPQHIIQDPGQVASMQMPVDVPFTCL